MSVRANRKKNWTQEGRRANLEQTANFIQEYGGFNRILQDMPDFEKFIAFEIGCSLKTAKEYIETVRGASIFSAKAKMRKSDEQ